MDGSPENIRKPRIPLWLLRITAVESCKHSAVGDLEELYVDRVIERGRFVAFFWLCCQTLRSVPIFFMYSLFWRSVMFKNYMKTALRNIKKHRGYSFINITGLAIGLACFILIIMWVQDELSYDTFHENAENLYRTTLSTPDGIWESSPWALVPTLKKDFPEIIRGTRYARGAILTRYKDNSFYEEWALVDPDFFEMFSFSFIEGDPKTAFSNLNSVVITEKTAEKYFGNSDPIGEVITFNNQIDLAITGVIQNIPSNSHMQFDLLALPVHYFGEARTRTWSADCASYILLQSNAYPEDVRRKIYGTINKYDTRTNVQYYVGIQPLKKIHLYALNGTHPIVYVYIFSLIAVIVLLIACINFMNLSTARSSTRAKEVGMRKVIGATRIDVIRQVLNESIILSFIALVVAVLLVYLFLPIFNTMASKQLTLDLTKNIFMALGLILIAFITGIISCIYPALFLSAFQPVKILKGFDGRGSKTNVLRKTLIIIQFTAAIILIISTATIYRQIHYIRTRDLGFNREHILTIRTNREIRNSYEVLREQFLKNKDVVNVTAATSIPLSIGNNNPVYWEGRSAEQYISMNFVCVDYDYFETFNMKMAHGRSFSREYSTDIQNYIINEAALKLTGYEEPVGRMFSMWTDEGEIIGVVKDFHGTSLHNEIRPIVFVLYQNMPYFYIYVKIRPINIPGTINFLKNTMRTIVPSYPFQYTFLDEYFNRQYMREDRIGNILKYFTFLAIFISCLGLLGLASFMAEQRTKEIAIRKVLGATNTSIVGILSKEFVILVATANTIAWPLSYYFMNKWIHGFAFHTNIGLWLFVIAGIVALIIAQLTVSYQSIKAARANPVDSLKYE